MASPVAAFAASQVYASAPMGAGGQWQTGLMTYNYNRMSAPSHGVSVTYCTPSFCPAFINTTNFVQISVFTNATAICRNLWSTITDGYCARYW